MPIRTRQIVIDEDFSLEGFRLLNLNALVLAERPSGALPDLGELLLADDDVQVKNLRVNDRLTVGGSDDAIVLQRAIPFQVDTRNSEWEYNGAGNVTTVTEFVEGTPVSITTFDYDFINRIASKTVQTNAGTAIEYYTYSAEEESDSIIAVTRTVVL
jgi:hypothetical protein